MNRLFLLAGIVTLGSWIGVEGYVVMAHVISLLARHSAFSLA